MSTVGEIITSSANGNCSTASVRKLSLQIIAEMNIIIPNVLVSFDDLNIDSATPAVNLYLQPGAKDALRRVIRAKGESLTITSAYRTVAQQHLLFSWYKQGKCGISLAATPGKSNHEDGLAIDVPDPANATWRSELEDEDWDHLGDNDRFHFTYRGGGRNDIGDIGVKAFQRLWNKSNPGDLITVDGDFGSQTAARMNRSPAAGFPTARLLKLVNPPLQGDDVRKVQQALVNVALLQSTDINSIYDSKTADAVGKFQANRNLSVDKVVGLATRRELGIPN
ncbi:peptidoglycan-binding protein [Chamaesiphon sp. VAR_48_metabat_135_sub]|uniref:peptidoglycan-binding protein n=1 Tax=Chamaesiphon sp. VAR_48_metabat_135_sub TaxID=2964699 RepID=UPI00286A430D|nr:peptidoglycan-binding protein [Chamaesiphon sp. VAR_48_metabat_135_sub]